jgi:hypothetical protein
VTARELAQLLQGNQVQQAVHVAAKLGIPDLLEDGPRHSDELAAAAGAHPDALFRLLRALTGFGIFARDEQGRFTLTPLSAALRSGAPHSVLPFALWSGGVSYRAFGGLEESVRTGEPAFEHLYGTEFFDYLSAHPESGAVFDEMMSRHTAPVAPVVARHELPGVRTVVDLGGGRGELLMAMLAGHPGRRGVLVDRPDVLDRARPVLAAAGVDERCDLVPGDIRRSVPPGDAYLLKSVLHGLDDDDAARVLDNCRRAGGPSAVLLLIEFVIPPGDEPYPGKLMDLLMLVGCHGRERTAEEFAALLDRTGFGLVRIVPGKNGYSIIEARPAPVAASTGDTSTKDTTAAR